MVGTSTPLPSFLGPYWSSIRKWFYPLWLIYETSVRFADYAFGTYEYINLNTSETLGSLGAQALSVFGATLTFIICAVFLTLPGAFILYQFFKKENISGTRFEQQIKFYF